MRRAEKEKWWQQATNEMRWSRCMDTGSQDHAELRMAMTAELLDKNSTFWRYHHDPQTWVATTMGKSSNSWHLEPYWVRPHTSKPPVVPVSTKTSWAGCGGGHKEVGEGGNGRHAKKLTLSQFLPQCQVLTKGDVKLNWMTGRTKGTEEVDHLTNEGASWGNYFGHVM